MSSDGIATALKDSASSLVAANNSYEEAVALIASANRVVQDPGSVGAALRTISLRLRGTSTKELEEAGEDTTGVVESKSKLRTKIQGYTGVDILTDSGAYKSTYDILLEISKVWDDLTDQDRAGLLELIAGKTRSNTAAAILSNTKDLEEALRAAEEAQGSALRENEKYLDSIQGRIDLFNNSVQTMWQNTLDSDVVKWFVDIGTQVIKVIDTIGLIPSILAGILIYLTAFKKINLFSYIEKSAQAFSTALNGGWKGLGQLLGRLIGVTAATKTMTAETVANTLATITNDNAKTKEIMTTMGLTSSTQMLTEAERREAIQKLINNQSTNRLTNEQIMAIAAQWGLKVSYDATTGSLKILDTATKSFMATNPIGWILAIISVVMTVVMLTSQIPSKLEKIEEKLDNLDSEISDITSEIDSLNSELETTQDRMSELLAMDSLSFTEQEELANLQAQNKELERQLKIKEELLKDKENERVKTIEDYIEETWNNEDGKGNDSSQGDLLKKIKQYETKKQGYTNIASEWETISQDGISEDEYVRIAKVLYDKSETKARYDYRNRNETNREGDIKGHYGADRAGTFANYFTDEYIDEMLEEILSDISKIFNDENFQGLSYGMSDYIDNFLDEYYNAYLLWRKTIGDYSISDVIASVFESNDKGTNALKETIDAIINDDTIEATEKEAKVLALVNDAADGTFNNIDTSRFKTSLEEIGISSETIARYFTQISQSADSSTIEGITTQYQKGINIFKEYQKEGEKANAVIGQWRNIETGEMEKITWSDLFDEDGEIIETEISKILQGADETVRKEFARIAKAVNEGKITVKQAMTSFGASGVVAAWELVEAQVSELNADVFKDLGDEISGVIDTVSELSSAFESVANSIDLVNQAQAEMAYSGHLSVETALQLMESTDNWNELLTIEEGNIRLVDNAEQILIQSKLDLIKKNLQVALSTVEAQLAQITATESSADMAYTIEESTNLAVRELAANMTYAAEMAKAYTKALAGEDIDIDTYVKNAEDAKQDVLDRMNYQKNAAQAIGREGLEAEKARLEAMLGMYESVDTVDEFKSNYSSDEVSGGNDTKEDAEKSLVENMLDEYERRLALITNERDLIEAEIDKMETQGGQASAQYYEDLIRNSNEEKALLQEKKKYLEDYLVANKNSIDSETWTEYNNELNETAVAIKECEINTIEWAEALREIDLHYFEQATDEISRLGEELDFVNSLLEDEEVADENGNWSSAALTRLGMYTQQMEMAAVEAQRYQEQIDKLNVQYKNGELSEEQYQEALSDLVSGQQDAIQSYEDAKDGIVELNEARIDAIKDGIDKEIEAYEDLIDLKKEELDAERDLYDFRKNVKKQTKDIATLERRIAALSGSTAASDVAERRKLQAELNEAREGLNDTYYERSRDQQSQALDDESEAFRESKEKYIEQLEEQLKDTETLIQQTLMDVLLNADSIYEQLAGEEGIAAKYGIQLSDKLTQPWKDASAQATAWKTELQNSMTAGDYAALIGEGGAITAFANGIATKMQGSWNTAQNAVKGYADFLTGTELGNRFSNTITGFGNQIQTIIDKWNGVKTAADNAYAAQTRQVTVGGVNTGGSGNTGSSDTSSGSGGGSSGNQNVKALQEVLNTVFNAGLVADGVLGNATTNALKKAQTKMGITADGKYGPATKKAIETYINNQIASWKKSAGSSSAVGQGIQAFTDAKNKLPLQLAKGTMGLKKDLFAITDESWIGEEITLAAGKNGQLQYLKKGSAVMPADISANLIEWGKLNPDMLKVGGGVNLNAISNAINKPEFNLNVEKFLSIDKVDQETLPEIKRFVQQEINNLVKQMNYALKGKGAR